MIGLQYLLNKSKKLNNKKANFKQSKFADATVLTREQLKKMMGGDGPETMHGFDFSTTGALLCAMQICQQGQWCCDVTDRCVSRGDSC